MKRGGSGLVSQFGNMNGLKNIQPKNTIDIMPYVVARTERFEKDAENPFRKNGKDYGLFFRFLVCLLRFLFSRFGKRVAQFLSKAPLFRANRAFRFERFPCNQGTHLSKRERFLLISFLESFRIMSPVAVFSNQSLNLPSST